MRRRSRRGIAGAGFVFVVGRHRSGDASRSIQAVPDLDQDAKGGLWRDEVLTLAAPVSFFVHYADAIALELLARLVEILEVDRHVMHPLAVARDELADEIVVGLVRRALDEFELEAGDLEMARSKLPSELLV